MNSVAIIPARFQNSYLHEAHKNLIKYALSKNDRVIIVLGDSPTRLTVNNPLSFEIRKQMIEEQFPLVEVRHLSDYKYDEVWCAKLDELATEMTGENEQVLLYGSRDSFISSYTGKYKTENIDSIVIEGLSASKLREETHKKIGNCDDWRAGIIYASAHKYPVSFQTVDIAIINSDILPHQVLLAKKPNEKGYRFVGGFVDVNDASLEFAAKREAMEETGMIETDDYKYIGSYRIDDWRYRKAKDKIMTAFFICKYIFGHPKATDDISELHWVELSFVTADDFESEHIVLFNALKNHLAS